MWYNFATMRLNFAKKLKLALLAKRHHLRLVYVFGSVARGDARAQSDIDIAYKATQPLTLQERGQLIDDLYKLFKPAKRPIDLVDLASAPPLLAAQVAREGRKLYGSALDDNLFYGHALQRAIDARPLFELTAQYVHARLAV